jgi:glutamate--cysteine ligase
MFLFKRDGHIVTNTGQPFRSFLKDGYQGHRATRQDWQLHLNTLFPEARLKNTLEVRPVDSLPQPLALGAMALFTGILYDEKSLGKADQLLAPIAFSSVQKVRSVLVKEGLDVLYGSCSGYELARELLELARAGLVRRGRQNEAGADESVFLGPLEELLGERITPAGRLLRSLGENPEPGAIVAATKL